MTARSPREADLGPARPPEAHGRPAHPTGQRVRQPGLRLTAPGGILLVLAVTIAAGFLDGLFTAAGYDLFTGPLFAVGCVVAAIKTRREDLPALTLTPPMLFVLAVTLVETVRSWGSGSWLRNEIVAVTMALAGQAFWIAAGTAATLLIAGVRALLGSRVRR